MASASHERELDSLLSTEGMCFSSPYGQPEADDCVVWQRQANGTFICQICRDARAHPRSKALRHQESASHKNSVAYMAHKIQTSTMNEPSKVHARSTGHGTLDDPPDLSYDLGYDCCNEIDNSLDSDLPAAQSEYEQIMGTLQDFHPNDNLSDEELVEQSPLEHEDGTFHAISHTESLLKCQITQNISSKKRSQHEMRLKNLYRMPNLKTNGTCGLIRF
jgi:hypothetical protein